MGYHFESFKGVLIYFFKTKIIVAFIWPLSVFCRIAVCTCSHNPVLLSQRTSCIFDDKLYICLTKKKVYMSTIFTYDVLVIKEKNNSL